MYMNFGGRLDAISGAKFGLALINLYADSLEIIGA